MSSSRTEAIAGRAHRLYVFGVIFSALFLLGFVLTAMIAADIRKPIVALPPGEKAPRVDQVDSTAGPRQAALDQVRAAQRDVVQRREQLGAAELALFRFLYDQLNDEFVPAAAAPVSGPLDAAPSAPPMPKLTGDQNPQVVELERELAKARQRKTALLEKITPSHPTLQSLDSSIADLEGRLESVRRTKVIEPAPGILQLPTVDVHSDANESTKTALNKAREMMLAAGRAQRDYDAAVAKESGSWIAYNHLSSDTAPAAALAAARPVAPSVARQSPAPRPVVALGAFFVLALGCGLAAARSARLPLLTFATAEEVEARLGIPMLGRLAWAGPAAAIQVDSLAEPRWLRRSVILSEVVLAIAIGSLVLLAITNFPLLRQIADDPLSGIAQGIAKIRDLMGN